MTLVVALRMILPRWANTEVASNKSEKSKKELFFTASFKGRYRKNTKKIAVQPLNVPPQKGYQ